MPGKRQRASGPQNAAAEAEATPAAAETVPLPAVDPAADEPLALRGPRREPAAAAKTPARRSRLSQPMTPADVRLAAAGDAASPAARAPAGSSNAAAAPAASGGGEASVAGAAPAGTLLPQPRRGKAAEVGMPGDFHEKLGPGAFAVPAEAQDIEDVVFGHVEYADLPPERKTALARAVTDMTRRIRSATGGNAEASKPQAAAAAGQRPRVVADGVDSDSGSDAEAGPAAREAARVAALAAYQRCSKLRGGIARKSELMGAYRALVREAAVPPCPALEAVLVKKVGKSHSGVLVVTVLMGPGQFSCPKDCHYCPDQPGIARSYLLREPGVLRGFRNGWDPVRQFYDRASALESNGHVVDKIELLILGGTFSFYPKEYADEFIAGLFYAANTYFDQRPLRPLGELQDEISANETARCRIIGLTVETRPDYITRSELRRFRQLGVTRVQVGIQHLDDDVLTTVNRDCPTDRTVEALRELLNAGFKVDAHWMPDLPGSTYEKDVEMFKHLLGPDNVAFQVDQWKVYPTMTVPFTKIKEWYDAGLYKPYAEQDGGRLMVDLIIMIMRTCPHRIRLNRIVRDIPTTYISGGEKRVNLRQVLEAEMDRRGIVCRDIRARECKGVAISKADSAVFMDEFSASGGTEIYISVENAERTVLFGHLRLRLPAPDAAAAPIVPALRGAALIRELHTYGKLVAVGGGGAGAPRKATQHVGVGSQLMAVAEHLAMERGFAKAAVIAGVGVRQYYARLGYALEDTYMVKELRQRSFWRRALGALFGI